MTKLQHVLIDLDGVIANWGAEWDLHAALYPHLNLPTTKFQTSFDLYAGQTEEGRATVNAIMEHSGFYANLEPISGAIEALHEMDAEGYDIRIVTSPWISNPTCASDKLAWVERHLGVGWGKRVIITSDKTLIRGDILIDDKPEVTGVDTPEWEHVWFTQPYNTELTGRRRLDNWSDWRSIIERVEVFA